MSEEESFDLGDLLGQPDAAASDPPKESEFLGESGLSVTGKARMEAAYGTDDGEGQDVAIVAQSATSDAGTIFHQVYRPWRGVLNPRWVRNWKFGELSKFDCPPRHEHAIISCKQCISR